MGNFFYLTLYLLALINPVSKIFIISVFTQKLESKTLQKISLKSSIVALFILLIFAGLGNIILAKIFHVELYSLKIAGGIILFTVGFKALTKGLFFETDMKTKLEDISIVPLASPMIAGPATITAMISFTVEYSFLILCLSVFSAVLINFLLMLSSKYISRVLVKYNLMGSLIRITGLIVATIAVQMVLSGVSSYYLSIK